MTDTRYITALRFPLACFVVLIHAHNTCWRNLGSHFIDDLGTFLSLTLPLFAVLPIHKKVQALSNNMIFIGAALVVTGFLLFACDLVRKGRKTERNATLVPV